VLVAQGTPENLKAEIGQDVVTVQLRGADAERTRAVIGELPGLDRVIVEENELALFVEDGASSIAEIVRRLDAADAEVGAISVSRPSLDDVFLEATGRRLEGAEQASVDQAEEEDEAAARAVAP
jgi:ABC-2 type transport system ATP-binding protein